MTVLHLLEPRIGQLLWQTEVHFVGAPTRVSEIFKILEDVLGLRSLLRFLMPALFCDLPDQQGYSGGLEAAWLRWSLPPQDQGDNIMIHVFGKRHLPGRKLEGQMV